MAEPTAPVFTQAERDALLNYRRMRRQDTGQRVGSVVEDSGRVISGKDPAYRYRPPGADNLTEEQKAKLRAQYAEILAKLAQAEREAQSSDQDFGSKAIITRNDLLKTIIQSGTDLGVADKQLAAARLDEISKIELASQDEWQGAQKALTLDPAGQNMARDIQKQVLPAGPLNSTQVLQDMSAHMGELSKTNPAQIPAYLRGIEAAFQNAGDPNYRGLDAEGLLTKLDRSDPGSLVLIKQLAAQIDAGTAAAQQQAVLYDQGKQGQQQAHQELMKIQGGMPRDVRDLMGGIIKTFETDITTDTAPQIRPPPATADVGAKKTYVERASGGKMTLNEQGMVVNAVAPVQPAADGAAPAQAPAPSTGPVTSYESFVQVYPGIHTDGQAASGGVSPTGGSYARSGPTQETIESIRQLRLNITKQIENLDNVNLDPLTKARKAADEALAGSAQGGMYDDPDYARKVAERTARAEQKDLRSADRAVRDARVTEGLDAASEREKFAAATRQGWRSLLNVGADTGGTLTGRERVMQGAEQPQAEPVAEGGPSTPDRRLDAQMFTEGAKRALLAGDAEEARKQIDQLMGAAGEPAQLRNAAKLYEGLGDQARADDAMLKADDMEYALNQAARSTPRADDGRPWSMDLKVSPPTRAERMRAQQALETDPTIPAIEDWQPEVPGRTNTTPQQGRDFARSEERGGGMTRSEQTGKDPLNSVYSMGDFGATESINRNTPAPVPAATFEQPVPAQRQRVNLGVVETPDEFESTGGDKKRGEAAAKAGEVAEAFESFGQEDEKQPAQPARPLTAEEDPTNTMYWRRFLKTSNELLSDPSAVPAQPSPSAMPMSDVAEPMTSTSSPSLDYKPQVLSLRRPIQAATPQRDQRTGRTSEEQRAWVESMRRTSPDVDVSKIKGSREEYEDVPLEDIPDWMKDPNVPVPGSIPTPAEVLAESDPGLSLRRRQRAVVDGAVSQ